MTDAYTLYHGDCKEVMTVLESWYNSICHSHREGIMLS